jgi:hypothetical protein
MIDGHAVSTYYIEEKSYYCCKSVPFAGLTFK